MRPLNSVEKKAGEVHCLKVEGHQSIVIAKPGEPDKSNTYVYDRVYDWTDTQEKIYNSAMKSVVLSTLNGYNGTIIAYGQTGTGKTHTIEGGEGEHRGLIPRASEEIFNYIEAASQDDSKFLVRISFLQIYCEKIADLLDKDGPEKAAKNGDTKDFLAIRNDPAGGVSVPSHAATHHPDPRFPRFTGCPADPVGAPDLFPLRAAHCDLSTAMSMGSLSTLSKRRKKSWN